MGSLTKYYRLYKPNIDERNWGEEVNQNWEILDKELFYLEKMIEKLSSMHNRHLRRLKIETEIKVYPVPVKKFLETQISSEVTTKVLPVPIEKTLENTIDVGVEYELS